MIDPIDCETAKIMHGIDDEMATVIIKGLTKEEKELLLQVNYRELACDYLEDFNKKCQEYETLQLENQRLKERIENLEKRRLTPEQLVAELAEYGYTGGATRETPIKSKIDSTVIGTKYESLKIGK
jgi:cell division protein FtsB